MRNSKESRPTLNMNSIKFDSINSDFPVRHWLDQKTFSFILSSMTRLRPTGNTEPD